jgi:3-hydroxy acid dehydrogenase / malonic semialdehyde reductase
MNKVLITGGSSGIGLAIAKKLLLEKNQVVAIARDFSKSNLEKEEGFFPFQIDLSKIDLLKDKLSPILKEHGDISSLILSAGSGAFGKLEELSFEEIKYTLNLNFLANVYLVKTFLPNLKKLEKATILFIGSSAALEGQKEGTIYCGSKFALRGFAQALRDECAKTNVKISIIQPSYVRTPFYDKLHFEPKNEKGHFLEAEDIAKMAYLILESESSMVLDEIILSPQKSSITFKKNKIF